jgi:hypothetical protein
MKKARKNRPSFVHENRAWYITKWVSITYCQIAVFQGFRMAIPRPESRRENRSFGAVNPHRNDTVRSDRIDAQIGALLGAKNGTARD